MQPDWEIWLDNHISPIIAKWLREKSGFIVKSSYTLKLYGLSDFDIYLKAKESGNIILISKDSDLVDIISKSGSPPKLISLKISNCDNKYFSQFWSVTLTDPFDYYLILIKIN